MRPDLSAATREQSRIPSLNLKGGLTSFMQLQRFPKIPVATRGEPEFPTPTWEEPCVPYFISRWGPIPLLQFKRNPDFPLAPQEEACLTNWNLRGTPRILPQVKRTLNSLSTRDKTWFPCSDSRGIIRFPSQFERWPDSPESTRVVPWDPHQNLRGNPSFRLQLEKNYKIPFQPEMRPDSTEATECNAHFHLKDGNEAWLSIYKQRGCLRSPS